ncbi:cysteine hydrolase family protein [Sinomonas terrae]|uniref:cysteine hydrolase family protein n=1 Tax=Sinomonas terrae TaxID=2908838 RepID=UPI0027DF4695|nr:isochorismatase family protein [Sinomonas terrae]
MRKRFGDAFEATDLEDVLARQSIGHLVLVGAQTDACIRSTAHGALPEATTSPWSATHAPRKT